MTHKSDLPKMLATGEFYPEDIMLTIAESNRKIDPYVEGEIEHLWEKVQKDAKEKGKVCYNGMSYRLNSLEIKEGALHIELAEMEFKVRNCINRIPEFLSLPEPYYRMGCFTSSTIKTADEKYIMVELSGVSMNNNGIDYVGGMMEPNVPVNGGRYVYDSYYVELEEEAGITQDDIEKIYLDSVYIESGTNVAFYFEVTLKIDSSEISKRFLDNTDQDIKGLKFYTKEEYLNVLNNHPNVSKHFVAGIVSI